MMEFGHKLDQWKNANKFRSIPKYISLPREFEKSFFVWVSKAGFCRFGSCIIITTGYFDRTIFKGFGQFSVKKLPGWGGGILFNF